jgi:hypothetical protein
MCVLAWLDILDICCTHGRPDISFAIWNGRGLNSPARRLAIFQAISPANAAVVCIQETKMAVISDRVVRDCLGPSFDKFFFL